MTTITKLDPTGRRQPTPEQSKKDAVAALVDGINANLFEATAGARKALDQFDETAAAHAARIKMELEIFCESASIMGADATAMAERVEKIRIQHARLVNARVEQ